MGKTIRALRSTLSDRIAPKDDDRPRRYWTARGFAGTAADLIGIVSVVGSAGALVFTKSFPTNLMAVVLCALALSYMVFNFRLQRRFENESRRAQSGPVIATCHRHLRNAVVAISAEKDADFAVEFFKASQSLAKAFSIATSQPCRVAVKDVGGDGTDADRSRVRTLCRSEEYDEDAREGRLPDYVVVEDNTDFLKIMEGDEVYFSNDLSGEDQYRNSHFEGQLRPHEYPYRSTIVWPIKGPPQFAHERGPDVIGFLCVDAEEPGTFLRRLDVPTGRAVAHAMYSSLSLYRARQRDARRESGE